VAWVLPELDEAVTADHLWIAVPLSWLLVLLVVGMKRPRAQVLNVGRHRAKRRNFLFFSCANSIRARSVRAVAVRQGWTR